MGLCRVLLWTLSILLSCHAIVAQDNIDLTTSTFPSTIGPTGTATVNIAYTSTGNRVVVVDVLNTTYSWFGKGTASVGTGSGTASISIAIQNNPPAGTNYIFNVYIVAASDYAADPANAYLKELQPAKPMAVTVTSAAGGGGTAGSATTAPVTPTTPTTPVTPGKYNYGTVASYSILFYEAQRSGHLMNNRIPFRGDSALGDKGTNGEDLTGGYYDAGDHVKFHFPAAYAMTTLAWGLIQNKQGYVALGEYQHALNGLKWGTDYLLKCHPNVNSNLLYAQVGDGNIDHAYWGRPEEMTMQRPVSSIGDGKPGSDLAGEVAAAFAAASIVFQSINATYSATLIAHARTLYTFADSSRGKYSDTIPSGTLATPNPFYTSTDYTDELTWAAVWLYQATGESAFLTDAKAKYTQFNIQYQTFSYSWDNKGPGISILMAQILKQTPSDPVYVAALAATSTFVKSYSQGGSVPRTPLGLPVVLQWASNRYACGAAWIALVYADSGLAAQQDAASAMTMATGIINYVLGDAGRSLVVGYGNTPPTHWHHRASSCPNLPATCGQPQFTTPNPNPQTLYGAMVGGPKSTNDASYVDARDDFTDNEVALDYNAAFQNSVLRMSMLSGSTSTGQVTPGPTNGGGQGTTPSPVSGTTPAPGTTPTSGTTPLPGNPTPAGGSVGPDGQQNPLQGENMAGKGSSTPLIIGGVVGAVAVLLVVIGICCYVRRQASTHNAVASSKMAADAAV